LPSAPDLAGYVGINDRIAGRTAAWAIARCASRAGPVRILIGSHGYLGQENREIGFRTYFREKAPTFRILQPAVCSDDPEIIAYKETIEMLHGSEKQAVGLYSIGDGIRGTIRAVEESQLSPKPAYVYHVITSPTRGGLIKGRVDVIIAPDMLELARAALQMCLTVKDAPRLTKQTAIVPFLIYTSENALESTSALTTMPGDQKKRGEESCGKRIRC
jgi:LacI family transcriptional regulator